MSVSGAPSMQYQQMMEGPMPGAYPGTMPGTMGTMGGPPPGHGDTHGGGGHGDTHGGHGGHAEINKNTGESPRRCTDLCCCVSWVILMIGAISMLINSSIHGNVGRLTHGVDYYGRTCGADPGVENKPFLYWCREFVPGPAADYPDNLNDGTPAAVNLDHPICIQACPTGISIFVNCLLPVETANRTIPGGQFDNVETLIVQIRNSKVKGRTYPTKARGGRYCMPRDETLRAQILDTWFRALGPMSPRRILVAIGTIQNVYWLFFCVLLLSTAMGYGYLYCIKFCPKYVVMFATGVPLLWSFAIALGFSFFWMPLYWPGEDAGVSKIVMEFNPFYKEYDVFYASWITAFFAVIFWIVFLFFLNIILKFDGVVISDLIHAVFDVFRTDPGMYLQPLFEAITKFIVFWFGIQGLKIIAAEGWIEKNNIQVNGAHFAGLSRDYTPSVEDGRFYLLLLAWILVWFWAMEICNAFGQFVTSYEVFQYYSIKLEEKKKKAKGYSIWKGIKYAWIYHFGSIVKGAITIWTTRPARFCYWASSRLLDPIEGAGCCENCVQSVVKFICCLGLASCGEEGCKQSILSTESPNKDGYHDVVIRSNDFDPAVAKGHDLLEHSHPIVKSLYQKLEQMTINVVGIISIASLNALMVYLFVNLLDAYKEPESSLYIADKMLVVFLAWILSAYIVFSFMTLWDHTCDALLYCYAWSRKWKRETVKDYIPDALRYIVGFDDTENDRYPYYGRAKTNMYLRSWMPMVGGDEKKKGPGKDKTMAPPRSQMSEQQGSYMSGFGTGFGDWGRQQQFLMSTDVGGHEQRPLLG